MNKFFPSEMNKFFPSEMKILNLTKKKVLSEDAKLAKSFLDNLLGLIKKSNPRTLVFKTRFGVHTFFLKEATDILILDSSNKVVKLKENLSPYRFYFWNPKYNLIIELPKNTIKLTKTKLEDKIQFE